MTGETRAEREYLHGPDLGHFPETCDRCNFDTHTCPGCGEWLNHGTLVCGRCSDEVKRGER